MKDVNGTCWHKILEEEIAVQQSLEDILNATKFDQETKESLRQRVLLRIGDYICERS